jgi:hypothetical protein
MSTVFRAISDHRILAYKGDTDDWAIERGAPPEQPAETALLEARIAELSELAELMRRQMDDLRADRDTWREQALAGARLLTGQCDTEAAVKHVDELVNKLVAM